MRRKSIEISHAGRTLSGVLLAPDSDKFPLVVFCHGFNGQGADFFITAEQFAAGGLGAFLFNFAGGGVHDKSGFPTEQMTLFTEKADLCAVLDYFRDKAYVEKMFLFGGSQGGMVAALTAEERGDVSAMTLLFPAFCIPEHWRKNFPDKIPERFSLFGMTLGREYFQAIRTFETFEHIGSFKGPVLILHGTEDPLVPLVDSERAAKLYPNASLVVFEGEKHGFTAKGNAKASALALAFFAKI